MAILHIPSTKAKATVEIDTDEIPEDVYREIVAIGLKVLVNRGTSKVTKSAYPNTEELKAAAMEAALKQVELIKTGKIRFTMVAKKAKASGAVMNEARRIARNLVKDAIREEGGKISHYAASEITKYANMYIEENPSIIEEATENLAKRDKVPDKARSLIAKMATDPRKVAAAESAKARRGKAPLSATQAGIPRARPQPGRPQPRA
jgi:hypothetical protein